MLDKDWVGRLALESFIKSRLIEKINQTVNNQKI
jgi:hypothetical protein